LARDGTILAKGDTRASKVPDVSAQAVGELGGIPANPLAAFEERGIPADAKGGATGLRRVFDPPLPRQPRRPPLAGPQAPPPTPAKRARATRPRIPTPRGRGATRALGTRLGGVVAIRPKTGEVLAFAGIAFSSLQPPGSTFKVITTTAALQNHVAKTSTVF